MEGSRYAGDSLKQQAHDILIYFFIDVYMQWFHMSLVLSNFWIPQFIGASGPPRTTSEAWDSNGPTPLSDGNPPTLCAVVVGNTCRISRVMYSIRTTLDRARTRGSQHIQ